MNADNLPQPTTESPNVYGVIDIGATSVRMLIAEVRANSALRVLENLSQAVNLGRDSFLEGSLRTRTIEDCVDVLKIYQHKLCTEYQIPLERIRVVATSAVREAANRQTFQDRVFIATGFDIEPFDEAVLHRVTYLGALPFLQSSPALNEQQTVICEIGGGSTELLVLDHGLIKFTRTYRLGSLRLQKIIESYHLPLAEVRYLMETQINQTVKEIRGAVDMNQPVTLLVMGGDMRLAAKKLTGEDPSEKLVSVHVDALNKFTDAVVIETTDHLVRDFSLSIPEAESFGPALLANLLIAKGLKIETLQVANANIRDGLIKEMAAGTRWSQAVTRQILQSAFLLGRKFQIDETHARHVGALVKSLFEQLSALHQIKPRYELLLGLAAILHEVGLYIGYRGFHKHSEYVIRNAGLFGIGRDDIDVVAQVARYHRRASPGPTHAAFAQLGRKDRVIISKLASILRLAKALDATRSQRVKNIKCTVTGKQVNIHVTGLVDLTIEELELREKSQLFREVFGFNVQLLKSIN
ncbi:MAG TPA: HD domain-containing protein [Pirellulaceae bacterium]|nr:HD domain-containing protein [Pirellulaceae bacterium]HMO93923.1 HD domain-containing protein [Pirellulaceae bacterium]HMP68961.1 HD domain-containing protein [Pirellulaceae bacterium]